MIISIIQEDLDKALRESQAWIESCLEGTVTCKCIVAAALERVLGVKVEEIYYGDAKMRDGTKINSKKGWGAIANIFDENWQKKDKTILQTLVGKTITFKIV